MGSNAEDTPNLGDLDARRERWRDLVQRIKQKQQHLFEREAVAYLNLVEHAFEVLLEKVRADSKPSLEIPLALDGLPLRPAVRGMVLSALRTILGCEPMLEQRPDVDVITISWHQLAKQPDSESM